MAILVYSESMLPADKIILFEGEIKECMDFAQRHDQSDKSLFWSDGLSLHCSDDIFRHYQIYERSAINSEKQFEDVQTNPHSNLGDLVFELTHAMKCAGASSISIYINFADNEVSEDVESVQ